MIVLSLTPGFSHSFSIFQNDVSPMALEIFRHSSSSGVLMTRAPDIAGHPLTMLSPAAWNAASATGSAMSSPIRSRSTPFSVSTFITDATIFSTIICSAVSAHFQVIAGRMFPLSHGASSLAHSKSDPAVSNRTGSPSRGSTQYRMKMLFFQLP